MAQDRTRQSVVVIAGLTAFIAPFTSSATNVALPAIQQSFHMDAVLLSWVQTAYLLSTAVFLIPIGRLADIYGRKRIFIYGIWIYTIASIIASVSFSGWGLLFSRVIQGVGGSMIFATGLALLTSVYPANMRGKVIGVNVAAVYVGLSIGPFFGGILTEYLSWRSVFAITVPPSILTWYFAAYQLPGEWADAKGEKLDLVGSILYGVAITLIMYGLSTLPSTRSIVTMTVGVGFLIGFVSWELRVEYPVVSIEMFTQNRAFSFSSLAAFIHYASTFAVTFYMSIFLQYIKGLDPTTAGLVLVSQPAVMALFSPLAGALSDRIEHRKVASLGLALTATGLFLLSLVDSNTTIGHIVGVLLFLGFGYALFSSPNMNAIMSSVERRYFGLASGAVSSMRLLGMMFSMGIAALIFSLYMGRAVITPDLYPVFITCLHVSFTIFSVLCVIGIGASLARGKVRAKIIEPLTN